MKRLVIILLIISAILTSAGCNGNKPADTQTIENVEINVYHPFGTGIPDSLNIFEQAKASFEKKYKNASVKLTPVDLYSTIDSFDYFKTYIASGSKIDVFLSFDMNLLNYIKNDYAYPVDNLVNGNTEYFSNVYDRKMLEESKVNGILYALPIGYQTQGILYNKNIIEKNGIRLNKDWTWDDFYDACKIVSRQDKVLPGSGYNLTFLESFVNSSDICLFNEQNDKCNLNNPAVLNWYKFEKKLYDLDSYYSSRYDPEDGEYAGRPLKELNDGKFAFLPTNFGIYDYQLIKSRLPNIEFWNLPAVNGSNGYYRSYYYYGYIYKKSDIPREAFEFLKFLVSNDIQQKLSNGLGVNPVNKDTLKRLADSIPHEKAQVFDNIFNKSKNYKDSMQTFTALYEIIYPAFTERLNKNQNVNENFLTDLSEKVNEALNNQEK